MVNYITGNDSNNVLNGTNNRDRLYGYGGSDSLIGYGGNDALFGGSGSDFLLGGDGIDWLQGGTGSSSTNDRDILDGGRDTWTDYYVLGNQTSSYYTGSGYATLRNFNPAYDYIVVADNFSTARITLSLGQISGSSAADTLIRMNGDLVGVVEDVNIANMSLSVNFIRSNRVNQAIWT
nr:MAG: calcium-binding protein [Leptolyngbya sp. IPPAS B-1204]